jgi:hypothetical protein
MIQPIDFPGRNVIFAENQPEYNPLPAIRNEDGEVIICFGIDAVDLERIKQTKCIYLKVLTFNQPLQPLSMVSDLSDYIELV